MAESYSVEAVLTAYDKGFTSAMKQAGGATDSLGKKLKSGLSFGIFAGIGQQAFSVITNGARDLISEIDSSNASWKTFEGNLKMIGKSNKAIDKAKNTMQRYAEKTVYSSSDMATTYAQLAAVGVKSVDKLVTGFGGLASAAENPQQAMKTLSTQATQMAAKPKVAWQDFKLMLEQTPAGIAAVAKEMRMSASELVTAVQDGKVKTDDFFNAIQKVGNNKSFSKMATEAKTMGQAMDGLKETIGNKLGPAFNVISNVGIKAINGIADSLSNIDGKEIEENVSGWIKKAEPYWESFKEVALTVGSAIGVVAGFFLDHADTIAKVLPLVLGLVLAYKGFSIVSSVVPSVMKFTKSITSLASGGIKGIASKLFGTAVGEEAVGNASKMSAKNMLAAAKAFMMLGAGVLMVSGGFALLAYSSIQLANAGPLAIGVMAGLVVALVGLGAGMTVMLKTLAPMNKKLMSVVTAMLALGAAVILIAAGFAILAYTSIQLADSGGLAVGIMVGMVAAIALLAVGAATLGTALTAGAVGFVALGAALLLIGTGIFIATSGMSILAEQLPLLAQYGTDSAMALVALGASMIVFAAGALLAGAGCIVLGAGLIVAAAGLGLFATSALLSAVGVAALGAGLILVSASLMTACTGSLLLSASFVALTASSIIVGACLLIVSAAMIALGGSSLLATAGMTAFGASMLIASVGVLAIAVALKSVNSSMKSISKNAKSTSTSLKSMKESISIVESGLNALGGMAKSAMQSLINAFTNTEQKVKSAGSRIGTGFSKGLRPGLLKAPIIAKSSISVLYATLNSGRSKAYSAGSYISKGFALGMLSQMSSIQSAANKMVTAADKAVRAKAKIHSPSKLFEDNGEYMGEGQVNGMLSKVKDIWKAAQQFVQLPQVDTPELSFAYSGGIDGEYDYYRNSEYVIEIPINLDGKEVARVTAPYTQEELEKRERRENRKNGRL